MSSCFILSLPSEILLQISEVLDPTSAWRFLSCHKTWQEKFKTESASIRRRYLTSIISEPVYTFTSFSNDEDADLSGDTGKEAESVIIWDFMLSSRFVISLDIFHTCFQD